MTRQARKDIVIPPRLIERFGPLDGHPLNGIHSILLSAFRSDKSELFLKNS